MKPANATFGGKPPNKPDEKRLHSPRTPKLSAEIERARWASCEEDVTTPFGERRLQATPPRAAPPKAEPRTGVMRRVEAASTRQDSVVVARARAQVSTAEVRPTRPREGRASGQSGEWSCLEWGQATKERRPRRNSKVTIVQLSKSGDLIRQNGPDTWLPDAGDFMQRMSRLVAQGLGFERCRSVCLKGSNAAITVTEAGDAKVVVVSGPLVSMANVLRRAGLQ